VDLGGPKKPCNKWGPGSPRGRGNFRGPGASPALLRYIEKQASVQCNTLSAVVVSRMRRCVEEFGLKWKTTVYMLMGVSGNTELLFGLFNYFQIK